MKSMILGRNPRKNVLRLFRLIPAKLFKSNQKSKIITRPDTLTYVIDGMKL